MDKRDISKLFAMVLCMAFMFTQVFSLALVPQEVFAEPTEYNSPYGVKYSPDGTMIAVTNTTKGQLQIINAATGTILRSVQLEGLPKGLAWIDNFVYVAEYDAWAVAEVNALTGNITRRFDVGPKPIDVAVAEDEAKLVVADYGLSTLTVIDLNSGDFLGEVELEDNYPHSVDLSFDEKYALIGHELPSGNALDEDFGSSLTFVDIDTLAVTKNLKLPIGASNLKEVVFSPDGEWAYVSHTLGKTDIPTSHITKGWVNTNAITIVDVQQQEIYTSFILDRISEGAADPWGLVVSEDGGTLWVTSSGAHQVLKVDLEHLHYLMAGNGPSFLTSYPNTPPDYFQHHGTNLRRDMRYRSKQQYPAEYRKISDVWLKIKDDPANLDLLKYDLGALWGIDALEIIKLPGQGPRGIAISPDGESIAVGAYYAGEIYLIDTESNEIEKTISLGEQPEEETKVRSGERIFHDGSIAQQSWLSCVTCHPSGRADGRNWDTPDDGFGNPKNTKPMLGIMDTAPLLSHGGKPDGRYGIVSSFEGSLNSLLTEDIYDDVQEYIEAMEAEISPYRNPDGSMTADAIAGKAIFESEETQCSVCHNGSYFTDLNTYNVGTRMQLDSSGNFDNPMLLELWKTAPYLHDGSAATVMDVLVACNPKDLHGKTSHLTERELEQLEAYLLQLDKDEAVDAPDIEDPTVPSPPQNLSVLGKSYEAVTLSWEASEVSGTANRIGEYNIYLDGVMVGWTLGDTTTYTVTGLTEGSSYEFAVRAINTYAAESEAAVITASTLAIEAPTAPANLVSTGKTITSVSLAWEPATHEVGVTRYNIYNSDELAGWVPGTETSYTVRDLIPDTAYTFTVTALDATEKESEPSNAVEVTTNALAAPPAPSNLSASGEGTAVITLSWEAPTHEAELEQYNIYIDGELFDSVPASTTVYDAKGLHGYANYNFTVTAVDEYGGESEPSNAIVAVTASNMALNRPASASSEQTNRAASMANDGDIDTRWNASSGDVPQWWMVDLESAYSITGTAVTWELDGKEYLYKTEVSIDGENWTTVVDKSEENESTSQRQEDSLDALGRYVRMTITGLEDAEAPEEGLIARYNFEEVDGTSVVEASGNGRNATLSSANIPIVDGPTVEGTELGKAVSLSGGSKANAPYVTMPSGIANQNSVTIASWVYLNSNTQWARLFDFGTSTSRNMFLTMNRGSNTPRFAITTGGSGSEQQINTNQSVQTRQWIHVAVTIDSSSNTGVLYINGQVAGTNTNMTLRPSSLGDTSNNWIGRSQYSDSGLNGRVADFRIYNRALDADEVRELTEAPGIRASIREFEVFVDDEGSGPAPTAPANLVSIDKSETTVSLAWDLSSDDQDVIKYNIYANGELVASVPAGTTSHTVTGLAGNTTYTFTVKAEGVGGIESGASNEVVVTTDEAPIVATNVALGKPVTSSSMYQSDAPERAVDGNTNTRWRVNNADERGWLQIDLGAQYNLTNSKIAWSNDNQIHGYKIEASSQGTYWTTIVDETDNTTTGIAEDSFMATARYVRITVTNVSGTTGRYGIREFEVYGVVAKESNVPTDLVVRNVPQGLTHETGGYTYDLAVNVPLVTDSTIALGWGAPTNSSFEVNSYNIYSGDALVATVNGGITDHVVTGLAANTTYNFTVKAKDALGNESTASNAVVATTKPAPNLALNKAANASSEEGWSEAGQVYNYIIYGNDGDYMSRWCSAAGAPQWWSVDLGEEYSLYGTQIAWEAPRTGTGWFSYTIEVSNDNENWSTVVDESSNQIDSQLQTSRLDQHRFTATGRYVRLHINTTSSGMWPSFYELEVYGTPVVPEPEFPIEITEATINKVGGISVQATVAPKEPTKGVVVFKLMKGSIPVAIVATQDDMKKDKKFTAQFPSYAGDDYSVKVFVWDKLDNSLEYVGIDLALPLTAE